MQRLRGIPEGARATSRPAGECPPARISGELRRHERGDRPQVRGLASASMGPTSIGESSSGPSHHPGPRRSRHAASTSRAPAAASDGVDEKPCGATVAERESLRGTTPRCASVVAFRDRSRPCRTPVLRMPTASRSSRHRRCRREGHGTREATASAHPHGTPRGQCRAERARGPSTTRRLPYYLDSLGVRWYRPTVVLRGGLSGGGAWRRRAEVVVSGHGPRSSQQHGASSTLASFSLC